MTAVARDLASRVTEARAGLDAHVREMVAWHFAPESGCPFWLERAADLGFDPRERIHGYGDLRLLGHFQDEWLRGGPVRRWVPKAYADAPIAIFETGGTTGVPKSRINVHDFRIDYSAFSETLSDEGFPRGADWLMLGPTGPRRLRLAIEHLAQVRGGIAFHVDLDPRWVNKLIRAGRPGELAAYKRTSSTRASPCCAPTPASAACSRRRSCSRPSARRWTSRAPGSPASSAAAPR